METTSTRRGALAMIATAPIASLPALAVLSASQKALAAGLSPNMRALFDRYRAIDRDLDHWLETVHAPACHKALAEIEAISHHRTVNRFRNVNGDPTYLTTSDEPAVATARRALKGVVFIESNPDADYRETVRELVDTADRRKAEAQRIHHELNIDTVCEREDALGDQHYADLFAVMKTPARSMADLLTKLEFVEETDRWQAASDDILADVGRLSGRA